MRRTVHWFDSIRTAFNVEIKHMLGLILIMPGCFPQFNIEHIGCYNFSETPYYLLSPHNFRHSVIQPSSISQKECRPRGVSRVEK